MGWARADYPGATYGTIGYLADGDFFKNHPLSGTPIADEIACVNLPHTIWSNVGYRLHEGMAGKLLTCSVNVMSFNPFAEIHVMFL